MLKSRPSTSLCIKLSSWLFKSIDKKAGEKHNPCLIPRAHVNSTLHLFKYLFLDLTFSYID
jgi:hypothetical protein